MDCRILGNESSSRAAVSISLCSAVFGNLSPTLSKSFPTFRLASIALSISPHLCYCYSFLRSFVCWLDCKFVRFNPLARGSSSCEGFNPLARGSILLRGVRPSCEGFNPLARTTLLRGVQSSCEGFNPLTRGSILLRGAVNSEDLGRFPSLHPIFRVLTKN